MMIYLLYLCVKVKMRFSFSDDSDYSYPDYSYPDHCYFDSDGEKHFYGFDGDFDSDVDYFY